MKRSFIYLFTLSFAATIGLTASAKNHVPRILLLTDTIPQFQLEWMDDFSGNQLNMDNWHYQLNGPWRSAYNDSSAVSVKNGNLVIRAYSDTLNNVVKHHSGYIASKKQFLYGRLEAKIAFTNLPGSWSAFWLMCNTIGKPVGNPREAGMEMDIVETLPNDGKVRHNIHWDGYKTDHKHAGTITADMGANSGNYHTYAFEWTPTYYKFYVDGKLTWTYTDNISQRTEYIILSTEIQDNFWAGKIPQGGYGSKDSSKTMMKVDYVKYYSLKK